MNEPVFPGSIESLNHRLDLIEAEIMSLGQNREDSMTNQIDEWVVVLTMLREKSGLYRDAKLCEIIEFLQQAKTNKMLSVTETAKMILGEKHPIRVLDSIERDIKHLTERQEIIRRDLNRQALDVDDLKERL